MSLQAVPPPLPDANPPQFYPFQFHQEFGYLAPSMRVRGKLSLIGKGVAFGAVIGAIAATIVLWPDSEARVLSVLSMQTQAAAGDGLSSTPVSFVAPTLALPAAAAARAGRARTAAAPRPSGPSAPGPAVLPSVSSSPSIAARPGVATAPAAKAAHAKAPPRQKKTVREPERQQNARTVEPDPRSAHASRFGELRRDGFDHRPFGFGW